MVLEKRSAALAGAAASEDIDAGRLDTSEDKPTRHHAQPQPGRGELADWLSRVVAWLDQEIAQGGSAARDTAAIFGEPVDDDTLTLVVVTEEITDIRDGLQRLAAAFAPPTEGGEP